MELYKSEALILTHIVSKSKSNIFKIQLVNGENRINEVFVDSLNQSIDIILKKNLPNSVVVTVGEGKFYSNGLDLSWISNSQYSLQDFLIQQVYPLFKKWLTLPIPTISLINGHAFAGGFLFALCHDYRIFNNSKGFLCMNELLLPSNLSIGFAGILKEKIKNMKVLRNTVLLAKRWNAKEALENGLVDEIVDLDELWNSALKLVDSLSNTIPDYSVYKLLKEELYDEAISKLSVAKL